MDLATTLTTLGQGMRAVLSGSTLVQPGAPVSASIVPSTLGVTAPTLASGSLDLVAVAKNVRFADAGPVTQPLLSNLDILGGMPIAGLTATNPGVPGWLGQFSGTIPIPMQVPVAVSVRWGVFKDAALTDPMAEGQEYVAPNGLDTPDVTLVFSSAFVEMTVDMVPPALDVWIAASVTLTSEGVTAGPVAVPPLRVQVPAIPVPTVAAFFQGRDLTGPVFVMVPGNSPLKALNQLAPALTSLQTSVSSLQSFVSLATFLLGLQELNAALAAEPLVQFRATQGVGDLEDIVWVRGSTFGTDFDADDAFHSLMLIAVPDASNNAVDVFNDNGTDIGDGAFRTQVGADMVAMVRDFDGKNPQGSPASATVTVLKAPPGGIGEPDSFSGEASAVIFRQV